LEQKDKEKSQEQIRTSNKSKLTVSLSEGQATPLLAAAVVTVRLRVCDPPPHVTEHGPKAPQFVTTQFTGHGLLLHVIVSTSGGHAAPPNCAATTLVRVRDCDPPPHVALQLPHVPQLDTTQSTGQF
jgi:hypothetical protein